MRAIPTTNAAATRTEPQAAIARASARTGVDFNYLIGQAQIESGMRTNARARTSSATGLYQFIEQSWLGVVKAHGAEHGLGWAADSIRQTGSGRYYVADAGTRAAILNLRTDANAASLMAAEHAADNKAALEGALGREATGTDLYMAHFLGLGGARKFLSAMQAAPDRAAAPMFPAAARANRSIFYAPGGQPRSLADIYQRFAGKLDRGANAAGAAGSASGMLAAEPAVHRTIDGMDVILGNDAQGGDDAWLQTTLANLNVVQDVRGWQRRTAADGSPLDAGRINALRPTPETARLAYLMLANLGAA
ncbi:lytic transglycosylase domain-containing protein [Sphingomonas baiyangensis]|uniref:Lytic transglycosylase domain-containing protein n=1 Tax=Sphingomonas baiyangensis TaxID=2572576 RepID=A0A4U1L7B3_9SPHN|nr:lytic transglycosylase domain-containing protein [Sphingomonas baiyangensis]TKD52235.1 lytic transglycosylase domain-containing protein [Sphingomonas baiyangensis]